MPLLASGCWYPVLKSCLWIEDGCEGRRRAEGLKIYEIRRQSRNAWRSEDNDMANVRAAGISSVEWVKISNQAHLGLSSIDKWMHLLRKEETRIDNGIDIMLEDLLRRLWFSSSLHFVWIAVTVLIASFHCGNTSLTLGSSEWISMPRVFYG